VATSEHVYEQDFELYLTGLIPNGKASVIEAHLGECESCVVKLSNADDSLSKRARPSSTQLKEERRDPRFATDGPGVLQIVSPFSAECLDVRVVDVSKNGLRLHIEVVVLPGSLVKVRMKDYIGFGESRYCVRSDKGFFVGVQLHDYIARRSVLAETEDPSGPTVTDDTSPLVADPSIASGWWR
jgi:hypothetical protein